MVGYYDKKWFLKNYLIYLQYVFLKGLLLMGIPRLTAHCTLAKIAKGGFSSGVFFNFFLSVFG